MKKTVLITLLLVLSLTVFAEQVVKIGIVNIELIIESHFQESTAYRELEYLIKEYENGLESIKDQVLQLQEMKLEAENDGDEERALEIDTEIYKKQRYMQNYHDVKTAQINERRDRLFSEGISNEIYKHIQYIAEAEGYSLILKKSDPNILFWSDMIDITEQVLESLQRAAAANN